MGQKSIPDNDDDMYEEDVTLEMVQERMNVLVKIYQDTSLPWDFRKKAGDRADALIDLLVEFLD